MLCEEVGGVLGVNERVQEGSERGARGGGLRGRMWGEAERNAIQQVGTRGASAAGAKVKR